MEEKVLFFFDRRKRKVLELFNAMLDCQNFFESGMVEVLPQPWFHLRTACLFTVQKSELRAKIYFSLGMAKTD